ncbi:hypothetical protein AgCh_038671 [Apium graveolens]
MKRSKANSNHRTRGGGSYRGRGKGSYGAAGTKKNQQEGRIDESSRGSNNGGHDKSRVKYFNWNGLGHYAVECKKTKKQKARDKEYTQESNLTQLYDDDEPTLLLSEYGGKETNFVMLNEESMTPVLKNTTLNNEITRLWYLDNGASNHMTGIRSKFTKLDTGVTGKVKFGDESTIDIEGKRSITFKCKNGEEIQPHERPFPLKTDFVAKEKLELIHGDLCGSISPPTPAGNRRELTHRHHYLLWQPEALNTVGTTRYALTSSAPKPGHLLA